MLQLRDKPRNSEMWERFVELGLPGKESETYRYVRLKELYTQSYELPPAYEEALEARPATLIFVNGSYCGHLSHVPKPWIALPFSEALKTYGHFLNQRFQKTLKEEKDPFVVLNGAYFSEGLFLYLPPKSCCEIPLEIVHLTYGLKEAALLSPRIHLFAGKEAEGKLYYSQKLTSPHVWVNGVMDIALEERAHVSLTHLSEQHEDSYDFLALRATLKEGSHFKCVSVTNGGATSRQDYAVRLMGAEAQASLSGVWDLKGDRQHHVNVLMDHQEPACRSLQKFKGVVRDHSRSSFEGKIYVHSKAQKTEAYQMNHNLTLSPEASANVKPNLEIFADDVKASHGATVGQLDLEHLFYLQTRGLTLESARALLIRGFSQEILELISSEMQKQEAMQIIS